MVKNNTSTNNTSTNNTSTNNTSTNNGTYTPYEWTCGDLVEPSGAFADLAGKSFDVTDGCVGANPFADLLALCEGAVVTGSEFTNWGGRLVIRADGTYTSVISSDFDLEAFVPELRSRSRCRDSRPRSPVRT